MRILVVVLFILAGAGMQCKPADASKKPSLDADVYETLRAQCGVIDGKDFRLYYFDGDCSFCVGKLLEMEEQSAQRGSLALYIARTSNLASTKALLKDAPIKSCLLYDDNGRYEKFFRLGVIYHIDREKQVTDSVIVK